MTDSRIPVGILGATGAVGQTFIRLLSGHPWFRVAEVAASERSAGKTYVEATNWLEGELPAEIAALKVLPCDVLAVKQRGEGAFPSTVGDTHVLPCMS